MIHLIHPRVVLKFIMTDHEAVLAEAIPRSDRLSRRFVLKFESIWGFIAYGVLWIFVACGTATAFLMGSLALVGNRGGKLAAYALMTGWVLSFLAPWWYFAMWVQHRLRGARRLFREGTFVSATVVTVQHLYINEAPFTAASLRFIFNGEERKVELSISDHSTEIEEGREIAVLFVPGYRYCATFPVNGKLVAASV